MLFFIFRQMCGNKQFPPAPNSSYPVIVCEVLIKSKKFEYINHAILKSLPLNFVSFGSTVSSGLSNMGTLRNLIEESLDRK